MHTNFHRELQISAILQAIQITTGNSLLKRYFCATF